MPADLGLGPMLILVFSIKLNWFNASGWDFSRDRILPGLTLGFYYAAYVARLTRGGMLEILNQDFIRTARAKGASTQRSFSACIAGAGSFLLFPFGPGRRRDHHGIIRGRNHFSNPGLGRYFVTSAFNRDYTLVLGVVLFYAALIIFFNLLVDIVQVWLNPKLKFQ